MAKAKETKYIVGDQGYLLKGGKVFQTGQEISLTDDEAKNVEGKIVKADTTEAKQLQEARGEDGTGGEGGSNAGSGNDADPDSENENK